MEDNNIKIPDSGDLKTNYSITLVSIKNIVILWTIGIPLSFFFATQLLGIIFTGQTTKSYGILIILGFLAFAAGSYYFFFFYYLRSSQADVLLTVDNQGITFKPKKDFLLFPIGERTFKWSEINRYSQNDENAGYRFSLELTDKKKKAFIHADEQSLPTYIDFMLFIHNFPELGRVYGKKEIPEIDIYKELFENKTVKIFLPILLVIISLMLGVSLFFFLKKAINTGEFHFLELSYVFFATLPLLTIYFWWKSSRIKKS